MRYYCTLFDSNYFSRGLAMYESLKKNSKNFHLYIFAFDKKSYDMLKKLNLKNVTVISLKQFEDEELLKVKPTRTRSEYCWTCTSSTILYVLKNYNVDHCTYLDADIFFLDDPAVLIEEMGKKSVLITEHRYTKEYDQSKKSGIYCVQFITFKKDKSGLKVLNWWRNACLKWCYARRENGKFGDQKYLDDWPERFEGIHVLKNLGGGVAPWNIQQYEIFRENNSLYGIEKKTKKKFKIIFYHFHAIKFLPNGKIDLGGYRLSKDIIQKIYKPFLLEIIKINKMLKKDNINFDPNGTVSNKFDIENTLRFLWRKINKRSNIYELNKIFDKNGSSD